MPKNQPDSFRTAETQETIKACYVYIIEHGTDLYHLTNYSEDVTITGLPAGKGSDPQTFTACQIKHDAPDQKTEISSNELQLAIAINDSPMAAKLRAMVIYTNPDTIKVTIIRVNTASLPGSVVYGTDTFTNFKGVATHLGFGSGAVQIGLISLILQADGSVPRYYWQKTCQHALYGTLCGLDRENFKVDTTIATATLRGRIVEIPDTTINAIAIDARTFQGGELWVIESGSPVAKITVIACSVLGGGAGTRLYLGWWHSSVVAGATVKVYRGCRKTVTECENTFDNKANFGGMPWIPDINPTLNGINAQ